MNKPRLRLKKTVSHWFTYHPWIKIISLTLAIMLWFYVSGEMNRFN